MFHHFKLMEKPLFRDTLPVSDMLTGAGERIEDRRLPDIRVAVNATEIVFFIQ